jgi:hypothetical protein
MMKKMITLASLAFMLMAAPASMQAQNIVNTDAKVDAKAAKKAERNDSNKKRRQPRKRLRLQNLLPRRQQMPL